MAQENENTVLMFDAELQREAPHTLEIDNNGEVVLTCVETGRFTKLPADTTVESAKAYMDAHRTANTGQITVASIEEKKAALLAGLNQPAPEASA